MKTDRPRARGFFFWLLTLLATVNLAVVVGHIVRQREPCTLLLAVVIVWVAYVRLQKGLAGISGQVDWAVVTRLQWGAETLCLMANIAIGAAVSRQLPL